MTNYTSVVPGSDSRAVSPEQRDLLLKIFSGEIQTTYKNAAVMRPYLYVRSVQGQKSVQFPAIGGVNVKHHQPGEQLTGQSVQHGEKTILIDDLLVADIFLSNYLEALNHFEVRGQYATEMGYAHGQAFDRKAFVIAINACLNPTSTDFRPAIDEFGNAGVKYAGSAWTAATFIDQVFRAQEELDIANVPEMERVLVVDPRVWNRLIQSGEILNRDYGNEGSQTARTLTRVAGLPIVKSNNLRINNQGNVSREGVIDTRYNVDASGGTGSDTDALGLILHKSCIGVAELMGTSMEEEYQVSRQGSLIVAKQANGMNLLRGDGLRLISGTDAP